jgi:nucleoid-associated protein YgaU
VIVGLDMGDSIRAIVKDHTFRVRQEYKVTFLRYVPEDDVGERAAVRTRITPTKTSHPKSSGTVYVVKAGDTLSSIAAKQLGDSSRWREIARLNNIRDPRNVKKGQKLRMPKRVKS